MIVLDTHALLWWALDPARLSEAAARVVERMERDGGFASAISVWEIGVKVKRGRLDIGLAIDSFVRRIESSGVVEILALDTSTWLQSLSLDWDHRDPADRVIVATARSLGLPLLTADASIRSFAGVETIW